MVGPDGNGLNLREGASTDAAVLTVIPEGASVTVNASEIADDSGTLWSQVDYDGTGLRGLRVPGRRRRAGGRVHRSSRRDTRRRACRV